MFSIIVSIAIILAALAGIVTSTTLLWRKVVKPLWRTMKRLGKVADVVHELPEWCAQVDDVLQELRPNHGGSIKDEVSFIKAMLEQHTADARLHHHDHPSTTVIVDASSTIEAAPTEGVTS